MRLRLTIIENDFGAWLSLVERSVRDREVGGSNPLAPTFIIKQLRLPLGSLNCFYNTLANDSWLISNPRILGQG